MASQYLRDALLKHLLGIAPLQPTPVYLAFGTQEPPTNGDPWEHELRGNGYARAVFGRFQRGTVTATYSITNKDGFRFPAATGEWPAIHGFGIYDSNEEGHLLLGGSAFGPPIEAHDWITIKPGAFTISIIAGGNSSIGQEILAITGQKILALIFMGEEGFSPEVQLALLPEPSAGAGYSRIDVAGQWGSPSSGLVFNTSENSQVFTFGEATSGWGNPSVALVASSGDFGDIVIYSFEAIGSNPSNIAAGDVPYLDASSLAARCG